MLSLKIERDDDPINPREDYAIGHMVCWHRQYKLGDEHNFTVDQFHEYLRNSETICLPLYLYNHSGLAMSTYSFIGRAQHAEWDSGRVGYIYITKADVRRLYGWKRITEKRVRLVHDDLRLEVSTYDKYLRGEVWRFYIEDEDGDIVDACGGYYDKEAARMDGERRLEILEKERTNVHT